MPFRFRARLGAQVEIELARASCLSSLRVLWWSGAGSSNIIYYILYIIYYILYIIYYILYIIYYILYIIYKILYIIGSAISPTSRARDAAGEAAAGDRTGCCSVWHACNPRRPDVPSRQWSFPQAVHSDVRIFLFLVVRLGIGGGPVYDVLSLVDKL